MLFQRIAACAEVLSYFDFIYEIFIIFSSIVVVVVVIFVVAGYCC